MLSVSPAKPPPTKPKAHREKEREKKEKLIPVVAPTERLKVVIRRLPPNLPEDVFWQSVQTWATEENISWKAFYPGKSRKRYVIPSSGVVVSDMG
jgi:regulator of nonsense transcripts 3